MTRPVILTLTGCYLPGYKAGGPLRSIVSLVASLGDGFEFRVLCADRDLGDAAPYAEVPLDRWTPVGEAMVHYTSPWARTLFGLARIIRATPHDVLYLNSFFSPDFTILPLVARRLGLIPKRPLVIAPRGEFSPGALALKSVKKRLYLSLAKSTGLLSGATWQASAEAEAADIRAALGPQVENAHVAVDLPEPLPDTPPPHRSRKAGAPLRIVFLSRISPKKNLDYALRALAKVASPVAFSIYGPPEDVVYLAECKRLARNLPAHVSVCWHGPVEPVEVPRIMADHDLFFLPTRGENFGHVIAEALGAGTPVLIADTTPWRNLSELGVGDDLPLLPAQAFVEAIDRAAAQLPEEASAKRTRAFAFARRRQQGGADIEANRMLFASLLARPIRSRSEADKPDGGDLRLS